MRSDQYTMTPRLCSFIATTNDTTPLPSGDGTRRYLCIEVTGRVDMTGQIPYKQLYAQAVAELRDPDCIYWLKIPKTEIDYPVMFRPQDKNYYLNRNFKKKPAPSGTLYLRL